MALLIDGYNLLHATGILGRGVGPGTLHRTRMALLNYLAASLDPTDLPSTTVVFDAHDPPPGQPSEYQHKQITVRYAQGYEDADALIEELIRADSAPRRLTVVSSDHRVQRAAKRRRATAVDSDVWYDEVGRRRNRTEPTAEPCKPLSETEVEFWLAKFSEPSEAGEEEQPPPGTDLADGGDQSEASRHELANPFPPGYADDLLDE